MKKIIALLFLLFPASGFAAQTYCTPKEVQSGMITGTLTNPPLPVVLDDARYKLIGSGGNVDNGNDLRPYSDTGTTPLVYQKIFYDGTNGRAYFRVKVPSAAVATTIYMCYGDSGLTADDSSTSVWPSSYVAFWPFPDGTTLNVNDHTASAVPSSATGIIDVNAGVINGGARWFTAGDGVDVTSFPSFSSLGCFRFWSNYGRPDGNYSTIIQASSGANNLIIYVVALPTNGVMKFYGGTSAAEFEIPWPNDTDYHLVHLCANGSGIGTGFVDGVSQTVTYNLGSSADFNTTTHLQIGDGFSTYVGGLDEVGIYNAVPSDAWIEAEYNSEFDNDAFWPDGMESAVGASNPQLISHAIESSSDGGNTVTVTVDTTGANICWAGFTEALFPGTFSNSEMDSWTELAAYESTHTATFKLRRFYIINPSIDAAYSVTMDGGVNNGFFAGSLRCYAVDDPALAYDTSNGGTSVSAMTTSYQIPSVSPSATTNFCIAAFSPENTITSPMIDSSFDNEDFVDLVMGNAFGLFTADKIGVGATESPELTWMTTATAATGATTCFRNEPASSPSTKHNGAMTGVGR